jgi:BirA family biotin operon repressor/biotin-[acetyl-CoA-carboxylase] ligase
MSAALLISLSTGLAAKRAIEEAAGLDADIRWPNDLLLNEKKCAGILVETAVNSPTTPEAEAMLRYAVIGVGINLNHQYFPGEIASLATSLRMEAGRVISRESILIALLRSLQVELSLLVDGTSGSVNANEVLERFSQASSWVRGKRVRVEENGGYTGITAGLDASGFLLVDSDDGVQRTVLSGGVRVT